MPLNISNDPIARSIRGEIRVCRKASRGRRREVELWLLNDDVTENNGLYTNLEGNMSQFADTPILVAYVGEKIGDGHNFTEKRTENGKIVASFMDACAERIVGYFRDIEDIRTEHENGKTWIVGKGYIWEWYARELVEKLDRMGLSGMPVSIETLVYEYNEENSIEVYIDYEILGTTILGEDVTPAVRGAHIKALSAIGAKKIKEITLKVASKIEGSKATVNPQSNIKGERSTMKLTEIKKQFPNHTVVAVDGENVALISENGTPQLTTCSKVGEDVIVGEKAEATSTTIFEAGDISMRVPTAEMIERINASCAELSSENDRLKKENKALSDAVTKMQTAEKARRKEACKAAVKNRIAVINEHRKVKIEEEVCNSLLTDEKLEAFSAMEDSDGRFVGEEHAIQATDSLCMGEILKSDETIALNNKRHFPWETQGAANDNATDLQKLANRLETNIE